MSPTCLTDAGEDLAAISRFRDTNLAERPYGPSHEGVNGATSPGREKGASQPEAHAFRLPNAADQVSKRNEWNRAKQHREPDPNHAARQGSA